MAIRRLLLGTGGLILAAAAWPAAEAGEVPQTDPGQPVCYDTGGSVLPCPGSGPRPNEGVAAYQGMQVRPIYRDNGDGTVTDLNTSLIWLQKTADVNGDGSITAEDFPAGDALTWQEAMDFCAGLAFAGHDDWRLPSKSELISIVDYGRTNPSIHPVFQATASYYWSETVYDSSPGDACSVGFFSGYGDWIDKAVTFYVRCARGGI